jgi:hypothetical protein
MREIARIAWEALQTIRRPQPTGYGVDRGYARSYGTHAIAYPRHAVFCTASPPLVLHGTGLQWAFVDNGAGKFQHCKQDLPVALHAACNTWRDLWTWSTPMSHPHHDLFNAGSYALSADQYDDLCVIRDKLLLMAQLASTASTNDDPRTMLFIRRALIG